MRRYLGCLTLVMLCATAFGGEFVNPPGEAKTREELLNHFGKTIGFGPVERAEFRKEGREVFAVWYCPFSGRAACYLHAYYYDPAKSEWILFIDRLIERTATLSAEMPAREEALIFKDGDGKIVLRESIAALPSQIWDEKK
jgi:hypothetical protein